MAESVHALDNQHEGPALFPNSTFNSTACLLQQDLPTRPVTVAPILDQENYEKPIIQFDAAHHEQVYLPEEQDGLAGKPDAPLIPTSSYLFPTLSHNERARLTVLWYHTWRIEQETDLLAKIDAVVQTLQESIGWEYAIAGIVNESTFTRLATTNLPIALLPRRESTCSHTINQAPGTVFMIDDMKNDWRFKNSPHVKFGGLSAYAGTQLRLLAPDGSEVALGSLCVASDDKKPPLTPSQRITLIRSAGLISAAIDSHTRQRRYKTRLYLSNLVQQMRKMVGIAGCEESILGIVREAYADANVLLAIAANDSISLPGCVKIAISDVVDGLWENTKLLDHLIETSNYHDLATPQAIRAIVSMCGNSERYLAIASSDVHLVFDDFDAWFVQTAASIIAEDIQSRSLKHALLAREKFLRGITHQLRTPIHGILSSTELLAEELVTLRLMETIGISALASGTSSSPSACIAALRSSGRELMTTVNNILRHNTWSEESSKVSCEPYDLRNLEASILPVVFGSLSAESLERIAIDFRFEQSYGDTNKKHSDHVEGAVANSSTVDNPEAVPMDKVTTQVDRTPNWVLNTDANLLRDCLSAVLLNAIQACSTLAEGMVTVTVRQTSPDGLDFDIIDNGIGIDDKYHALIFEAFEKVDDNKAGAGLGLTTASKIARELSMTLQLVQSQLGSGSFFRLHMDRPDFVLDTPSAPYEDTIPLEVLPRHFSAHTPAAGAGRYCELTMKYLRKHNFKQSEFPTMKDGLIISNSSTISSEVMSSDLHRTIVLCFAAAPHGNNEHAQNPRVLYVTGPISNLRLRDLLLELDTMYAKYCMDQQGEQFEQKLEDSLRNAVINQPHTNYVQYSEPVNDPGQQLSLRPRVKATVEQMKALLVDDNLINLRILEMFCKKRKISYITATDGNIAIEQYRQSAEQNEPITLVFMDLQMPNCDGLEATRAIRRYEDTKQSSHAYILMITGQDSDKDRLESKEAGSDVFLGKPVSPKKLDAYIAQVFPCYKPVFT